MDTAILAGIITLMIFIVIFVIFIYNQFVTLRQRVDNSWAQIDVQLKRRHELIPNFVEAVKAYAAHEQSTLENVTRARTEALSATQINQQAGAETMLTDALQSLFSITENYPALKADENFCKLQLELTNTENQISFARQFYNDTAEKYNVKIEMFPYFILARIFHFESVAYFNISTSSAARQAFDVDL